MANILNETDTKAFKAAMKSFLARLGIENDGLSYTAEEIKDGEIDLKLYFTPAHSMPEMAHIGSAMIGAMVSKRTADQINAMEEQGYKAAPVPKATSDGKVDIVFSSVEEFCECVGALTTSKLLRIKGHQPQSSPVL
jgi:hypothetical protein